MAIDRKIITVIIIGFFSINLYAARIADLNEFNQTKKCTNCDLSGVTIEGNFDNGSLTGSDLSDSTLRGSFKNLNLLLVNFQNSTLSGDFTGTLVNTVNFSRANLSYSNFSNVDFSRAGLYCFEKTNLNGANLTGGNYLLMQLEFGVSLCETIMPDGKVYYHC